MDRPPPLQLFTNTPSICAMECHLNLAVSERHGRETIGCLLNPHTCSAV